MKHEALSSLIGSIGQTLIEAAQRLRGNELDELDSLTLTMILGPVFDCTMIGYALRHWTPAELAFFDERLRALRAEALNLAFQQAAATRAGEPPPADPSLGASFVH